MAVSKYAFWRDVAERVGMTFAQSFIAIVVVGDWGSVKAAGIAGATASLSLLKSLVASRFGDGSASAVD